MPTVSAEAPLSGLIAEIVDQINTLSESNQGLLFHQFGYGSAGHLSDDALVSDQVASAELGVTTTTLAIWRSTGRYHLPYVKMGRLVRYQMGDLREFKRARRVDTRAAGGD
jgi:hypothetical protein